jgi:hypothetical protein
MKYITGSISSGTLKPTDLIDDMLDTLSVLTVRFDYYADLDSLVLIQTTLDDLLRGDLCPPYHYFGAHEGDGADIGFWLSQDSLNEAIADNAVYRIDANLPWDVSSIHPDSQYVLEVTAHGKMTLFDLDHNELWFYG